MSGPAIIAVVGMAMGAKTALEGIKEGNLAKAVLGGVGAYLGASGLSSIAGEAATAGGSAASATGGLGTEAAKQTATEMASGAAPSAAPAVTDVTAGATPTVGAAPVTEGLAVTSPAVDVLKSQTPNVLEAGSAGAGTTSPGFLSSVGSWMNKNPALAYGAMQIGGSAIGGYSTAEMQQKILDEQKKREDEKRKRIGYQPDQGFMNRYQYNPSTATWSAK